MPVQYIVFSLRTFIPSMAAFFAAISACAWAASDPRAVDAIQTMVPIAMIDGAIYADGQVYLPSDSVSLPLVQSCETPSQAQFADGETIEANEVHHVSAFTDVCPTRLDRFCAALSVRALCPRPSAASGPFSLPALQTRLTTAFCEKDCRR